MTTAWEDTVPMERIVIKVSATKPEHFHSIKEVKTNRPWWKWWFPKYVYEYSVIEMFSGT